MPERERPQIVVVKQGGDHGCIITVATATVGSPVKAPRSNHS